MILTFLVLPESDLGFLAFLVAGGGGSSSVDCSLMSEAVSAMVGNSNTRRLVLDSMEASLTLGGELASPSDSGFSVLLGSSLGEDQAAKNWCILAVAGVPKLACIKANQSGKGTPSKAVIMPVSAFILILAVLSLGRDACLSRSKL